jgi:hypothetical protein
VRTIAREEAGVPASEGARQDSKHDVKEVDRNGGEKSEDFTTEITEFGPRMGQSIFRSSMDLRGVYLLLTGGGCADAEFFELGASAAFLFGAGVALHDFT